MKQILCSLGTLLIAGFVAQAETIGMWTFEPNTPSQLPSTWQNVTVSGGGGNYVGATWSDPGYALSDVGTGQAGGVHTSTSTQWMRPAGNGSPSALMSSHWSQGNYYWFTVDVPSFYYGWGEIRVSYDQNGSSTSPRTWSFAYSTDNVTFTSLPAYDLTSGVSWSSTIPNRPTQKSFDLSAVGGLNTASTLYFRVVNESLATGGAINLGAVATSGTSRIDNFIVTVPEPASLSLLGCFGLLAWAVRRK